MSREEALGLIGSESEPAARRGGGAERAVAGGNVLSMDDDEGQVVGWKPVLVRL